MVEFKLKKDEHYTLEWCKDTSSIVIAEPISNWLKPKSHKLIARTVFDIKIELDDKDAMEFKLKWY